MREDLKTAIESVTSGHQEMKVNAHMRVGNEIYQVTTNSPMDKVRIYALLMNMYLAYNGNEYALKNGLYLKIY